MNNTQQIVSASIVQALQELRANKLRTFLSLLGITIGIFCIIAVLTALDSARGMIQKNVQKLGSDVLYIERWPWPGVEQGEYKWWEYARRPSLTMREANAVNAVLNNVAITTLALSAGRYDIKYNNLEISNTKCYSINQDFDRVQNIELTHGRFLSAAELGGGNFSIILGHDIYNGLFPNGEDPLGKSVTVMNRKFNVVGVIKKVGSGMSDFDFDNGVLFPYNAMAGLIDVRSLDYNPRLLLKARNENNVSEVKDEARGIIRRLHRIKPDQADDFAVNQLNGISGLLDKMFATIKLGGWVIGGFSLLVGAFGIANIMFVTVKERTKIIGLKKAIGARRSSILMEFLLESIVLCILGGLTGILLVLVISIAVSHAFDMEIVLSMGNFLLGVVISIVVGIIAGFVPAYTAAKLDPVVAIRTN